MEKETHAKESLAKHDLADCIGSMQTLCVVKKTQHGIYLAKLCDKDSLDSMPLRQTAKIKAQNNKRLDFITNCHVERSETSNIESRKDFLLDTQNDKDTESKQNLDSALQLKKIIHEAYQAGYAKGYECCNKKFTEQNAECKDNVEKQAPYKVEAQNEWENVALDTKLNAEAQTQVTEPKKD